MFYGWRLSSTHNHGAAVDNLLAAVSDIELESRHARVHETRWRVLNMYIIMV